MANYVVPGLIGAASGAGAGAAIGGPVGAAIGGVAGLGSSIYNTYQTEQQTAQMQSMIEQNYQAIINAINNEYTTGQAGIGSVYSAGQKVAKARTNQMLGGQGLAGSPIAAAINSEWGSDASIAAAGQETALAKQKAAEITQATANKGEQNQQLQYANMQANNQQVNNGLDSWKSVGSLLGDSLTGSNTGTGTTSNFGTGTTGNGSGLGVTIPNMGFSTAQLNDLGMNTGNI